MMTLDIQHNQDGTYAMQSPQTPQPDNVVRLSIRCPGCGTKLKIRERMLNCKGKCPRCGQRLIVKPRGYLVQVVVSSRSKTFYDHTQEIQQQ